MWRRGSLRICTAPSVRAVRPRRSGCNRSPMRSAPRFGCTRSRRSSRKRCGLRACPGESAGGRSDPRRPRRGSASRSLSRHSNRRGISMNRLAGEQSPYLLQHAHNPVDWYPWGEAAFEKARRENKPIFLSIGYSTCHWCHVMERESFENGRIAELLNRDYVPIKVDREERPDVDRIYMTFVQASTGSGGWPMSVWLTPELQPFFGGTYFPPDNRFGQPGFASILGQIAEAWRESRGQIEQSARDVVAQLRQQTAVEPGRAGAIDTGLLDSGFFVFRRTFDSHNGGFGGAPKFPRPAVFDFLLRYHARTKNREALEMVLLTLRKMAEGGMHDQLGGGFHRYSVDERWFVPHFEKMLYDQAQLATSYLEAFQLTGESLFADTARDVFAYVLRDLRDPSGAFYSAEDADSPEPEDPSHSGEGAFYIWSAQEIEQLLGPALYPVFAECYGVERNGNVEADPQGEFVGRNILFVAGANEDERLTRAKQILLEARSKRPRPHLDNKVLTSWNALLISALAKGYAVLNETEYRDGAASALEFLLSRLYDRQSGRLLRRFCNGEAAIPAFLDDYAFLAQALLDVFEIRFDLTYLELAEDLATRGFRLFEDTQNGGFFSTTADAPDLLVRMKDDYDGAEPSGNSVATDVLIRLARLTGKEDFEIRARRSLESSAAALRAQGTAQPQMLAALGRYLAPPAHVIIRARERDSEAEELLRSEWKKFEPNTVVLLIDDRSARQWSSYAPVRENLENKGRITIYRCENYSCALPEVIR